MRPYRKSKQYGINIIEIVVSMILIMTVMMALAFVYPKGRQITESSDKRTKATEIARSIIEEIQLLPLTPKSTAVSNLVLSNIGIIGSSNTLTDFFSAATCQAQQWPFHHYAGTDWRTKCPVVIGNPTPTVLQSQNKDFFLPTQQINDGKGNLILSGITVRPTPTNYGRYIQPTAGVGRAQMATFKVTVCWYEQKGGAAAVNFVSLNGCKTENRY